VFSVRLPIVAPVNDVEVPGIVMGDENAESVDFSHLITLPVFPVNNSVAGLVPEHIVWSDPSVPPMDSGFTVTKNGVEMALGQEPFLTTTLNLVFSDNVPEVYVLLVFVILLQEV
jgi:hypothetical protein